MGHGEETSTGIVSVMLMCLPRLGMNSYNLCAARDNGRRKMWKPHWLYGILAVLGMVLSALTALMWLYDETCEGGILHASSKGNI